MAANQTLTFVLGGVAHDQPDPLLRVTANFAPLTMPEEDYDNNLAVAEITITPDQNRIFANGFEER